MGNRGQFYIDFATPLPDTCLGLLGEFSFEFFMYD